MAAINPNWTRWIKASVFSHLETELLAAIPGLQVLIEPEPGIDHGSNQQWVELRMDGPDYDVYPSREWGVEVEINVLMSRLIGDGNIYTLDTLKGAVQEAMSGTINITKRGDGAQDDGSHVACLRLSDLFTRDFGRVGPSHEMHQATTECDGYTEITV
jgi:hypothetical protein